MIRYPEDYNPILEYWQAIQDGKIRVCQKVRKTYDKLVRDIENPGEYFYSAHRANHVLEFFENFCHHSQGKCGGQKVKLELWEKAFLAAVFGFVDINGVRRCREATLIVGKKNGKSLLASGIGLYMLVGDGEPGPQVYSVATKKDQAKVIWNESRHMVQKSPTLRKKIKITVSELSSDEYNAGSFKPLASDSNTLDGLNIHCCLMDEIHQWKSGKALYDIMADGITARVQPLILITTTAGTIRENIYDQKYEEGERLIEGYENPDGYKDEHRLFFIYELDNRNEWTDPDCWIKANPGLGTIKNLQELRNKVERAKQNPALVKNLVCKEFNIRETSTESWLTFVQLDNAETFDVKELKPRYGIGGVDLSSTTDLTCATVVFKTPDTGDKIFVMQMYFLPEDLLDKKVREDQIPYDIWLERGLLRVTPGNKVHYTHVTEWFREVQRDYDIYIYKVGYDSWSATYFVEEMASVFGRNVMVPVIQGKKTLSQPMQNLGADLEKKKVVYNNNPILKWCLTNTCVDVDKNGNIQPKKSRTSTRKIDGLASLLDAYVVLEDCMEEYESIM